MGADPTVALVRAAAGSQLVRMGPVEGAVRGGRRREEAEGIALLSVADVRGGGREGQSRADLKREMNHCKRKPSIRLFDTLPRIRRAASLGNP